MLIYDLLPFTLLEMSDPNGIGGGAESIKSSSSDTKGISLASILDIF